MNIEWTVTVPDGYEAVATDGTLEAKPIARPLPAPLAVAGALYELGGGLSAARGLLWHGSSESAAAKNELRQDGMAKTTGSTFSNYDPG